jgi:ribosomal protein S18 acetylase RimI-like enzyme
MPELAPYVSDAQTWEVRRELYAQLPATPETLLLLGFVDDAVVGYGSAHVLSVDETWIPDTWATAARIGEIESLSVLPQYRGGGLGTELLERLERHLRSAQDFILGVLPRKSGCDALVRTARLSTDLALPLPVSGPKLGTRPSPDLCVGRVVDRLE